MSYFDELLATTLKRYEKALAENVRSSGISVVLEQVYPRWEIERDLLNAIGPEHKPNIHDLRQIELAQFVAELKELWSRWPGVEITSYEEIDIHYGSAWASLEDAKPDWDDEEDDDE